MKIIVSEYCIEKGEKGSRCGCAIALAMAEAGLDSPSVGLGYAGWFTPRGDRMSARLPEAAVDFIRNFDIGKHLVEPFEFEFTDIEVVYDENQG